MIRFSIYILFLFGVTSAIDFKWDFGGWTPIAGPCKSCVAAVSPVVSKQEAVASESRTRRQYFPEQSLQVDNTINTIPLELPSRVQLVYLPEGSLEDLWSAQLAKVASKKPQLRHVRATNLQNGPLPTFREISPKRPTALIAEIGREREAHQQIKLLETALNSQQIDENFGDLPRVFIAPTHIPPPPGYVKIPLLSNKNREVNSEPFPGTFLTSDTQNELPLGFVQVPLPENVAFLSHGIPFVHPKSSPHLMAHFSPAGTLQNNPFEQPQNQPEPRIPNLIPIPPKSILQKQRKIQPAVQEQNFVKQDQSHSIQETPQRVHQNFGNQDQRHSIQETPQRVQQSFENQDQRHSIQEKPQRVQQNFENQDQRHSIQEKPQEVQQNFVKQDQRHSVQETPQRIQQNFANQDQRHSVQETPQRIQQNFVKQDQSHSIQRPTQRVQQSFGNENRNRVRIGSSVIRPSSGFEPSADQNRQVNENQRHRQQPIDKPSVQRLIPQPVGSPEFTNKAKETILEIQELQSNHFEPEENIPLISSPFETPNEHLPSLSPTLVNPNPVPSPVHSSFESFPSLPLQEHDNSGTRNQNSRARERNPSRTRINSLTTNTEDKDNFREVPQPNKGHNTFENRPKESNFNRRPLESTITTTEAPLTTEFITESTVEILDDVQSSTLFPPFSVARQKSQGNQEVNKVSNTRVSSPQRPGFTTRRERFGSRLRSTGRRPTSRNVARKRPSTASPVEIAANTAPVEDVSPKTIQPTENNSSNQRLRGGIRRPGPEWLNKRRRRVLSRVRKVPASSGNPVQEVLDSTAAESELHGSASAKVVFSQSPERGIPRRNVLRSSSSLKHRPDVDFGMRKRVSVNKVEILDEIITTSEASAISGNKPIFETENFYDPNVEYDSEDATYSVTPKMDEVTTGFNPFASIMEENSPVKIKYSNIDNFDDFFDVSTPLNDSFASVPSNDSFIGSEAHIVYAVALSESPEEQRTTIEPTESTLEEFSTSSPNEATTTYDPFFDEVTYSTSTEEMSTTDSPSFNFLQKFFHSVPTSSPNEIPDSKRADNTVISQSVVTEVRSSAPVICFGEGNCVVSERRKRNS